MYGSWFWIAVQATGEAVTWLINQEISAAYLVYQVIFGG